MIVFRILSFALVLSFGFSKSSIAQVLDSTASGHALKFNGIDDYVDFGSIYHDVNLPFTVSAWVYLDPSSGVNPIFATNDNPVVYRGFIFLLPQPLLGASLEMELEETALRSEEEKLRMFKMYWVVGFTFVL